MEGRVFALKLTVLRLGKSALGLLASAHSGYESLKDQVGLGLVAGQQDELTLQGHLPSPLVHTTEAWPQEGET